MNVGVSYESPDVSPAMLCVYNAKTKKKQELGEGYSPKIYGNNEYSDANEHSFRKFRAPLSGKTVHIFPEVSAMSIVN